MASPCGSGGGSTLYRLPLWAEAAALFEGAWLLSKVLIGLCILGFSFWKRAAFRQIVRQAASPLLAPIAVSFPVIVGVVIVCTTMYDAFAMCPPELDMPQCKVDEIFFHKVICGYAGDCCTPRAVRDVNMENCVECCEELPREDMSQQQIKLGEQLGCHLVIKNVGSFITFLHFVLTPLLALLSCAQGCVACLVPHEHDQAKKAAICAAAGSIACFFLPYGVAMLVIVVIIGPGGCALASVVELCDHLLTQHWNTFSARSACLTQRWNALSARSDSNSLPSPVMLQAGSSSRQVVWSSRGSAAETAPPLAEHVSLLCSHEDLHDIEHTGLPEDSDFEVITSSSNSEVDTASEASNVSLLSIGGEGGAGMCFLPEMLFECRSSTGHERFYKSAKDLQRGAVVVAADPRTLLQVHRIDLKTTDVVVDLRVEGMDPFITTPCHRVLAVCGEHPCRKVVTAETLRVGDFVCCNDGSQKKVVAVFAEAKELTMVALTFMPDEPVTAFLPPHAMILTKGRTPKATRRGGGKGRGKGSSDFEVISIPDTAPGEYDD